MSRAARSGLSTLARIVEIRRGGLPRRHSPRRISRLTRRWACSFGCRYFGAFCGRLTRALGGGISSAGVAWFANDNSEPLNDCKSPLALVPGVDSLANHNSEPQRGHGASSVTVDGRTQQG